MPSDSPAATARTCRVGPVTIGPGHPLAVIAGPCTLESAELGFDMARACKAICDDLGLPFIFKASFDKANRSSAGSKRGPGMAEALDTFRAIKAELGVPATTDIHSPEQAEAAAEAVDLLQIPAFLCRQTDLVVAAARAAKARPGGGGAMNIKKGQFLSPKEMAGPVRKATEGGCENIIVTERGTFFGYHRLVNDFTGLGDLMELDCSSFSPVPQASRLREDPEHRRDARATNPAINPATQTWSPPVCFDITHSTQLPGSGEQTGGRPDRAPLLARAATAAGVHALFIECHPNPPEAWSDGATQLRPDDVRAVLTQCAAIRRALIS
jgi:2-dehydro-3-deoxyphosphooctonate aldolase (KDO 8-P synthase)